MLNNTAAVAVTQRGVSRGQRLYPNRSNRLYWHLTCLRREIESVISQFVQKQSLSRVVDYGCGNMPYRPLFEPHVQQYLGCDLDGNERIDRQLKPDGSLPFDTDSADVVLSSQVLEHVADPARYLEEARRVLQPAGSLILSTHGVWKYHPDPTDFWRWTCDGLKAQVERAGFRVLHFRGVMGPEASALQLLQDAILPRVPKWRKTIYIRQMQRRIERADRRCCNAVRDRDACVYVIVAGNHDDEMASSSSSCIDLETPPE